jgi:hypothetical protein
MDFAGIGFGWPMLTACIALCMLRDLDARWNLCGGMVTLLSASKYSEAMRQSVCAS